MSLPAPKVLKIDHRWARGQYYSRSSGLVLTDDGSVVIFDGYGNRISMADKQMEQAMGGKGVASLVGGGSPNASRVCISAEMAARDAREAAEDTQGRLAGAGIEANLVRVER